MIRIQEYVAAHFREPIRADDLAGYLCCSPAQVYRLFRRYFSLSPANYINRVRLQNAAHAAGNQRGIRHSHRRCVWL